MKKLKFLLINKNNSEKKVEIILAYNYCRIQSVSKIDLYKISVFEKGIFFKMQLLQS